MFETKLVKKKMHVFYVKQKYSESISFRYMRTFQTIILCSCHTTILL